MTTVQKKIALFHLQLAEQARTSTDSQLKTARELNQQLEARLVEAEKEKLELHEEKMKAVESVEERVWNSRMARPCFL